MRSRFENPWVWGVHATGRVGQIAEAASFAICPFPSPQNVKAPPRGGVVTQLSAHLPPGQEQLPMGQGKESQRRGQRPSSRD